MKLDNTKSIQNMIAAFSREAQAVNRYEIYALVARQEGCSDVADLFEKMAQNEREHAKIWYKLINNGVGNTLENLRIAASGENEEWKSLYPRFAAEAREEGLEELAITFERIASIECDHERKFIEATLRMTGEEKGLCKTTANTQQDYCCICCGHTVSDLIELCPVCLSKNTFVK